MQKFKLLFVDHTPFVGGAQLALLRHLRHLDRSLFTPVVCCSPAIPELWEKFQGVGAAVSTVSFGRLKVFPLLAVGRLLVTAFFLGKAVSREKIDLLVANSERAFYPALLVSFWLRKRLILWVRDFEYPSFLLKVFDRWVSKFVFVSRAVQDYYRGQNHPKAAVVYVGTEVPVHRPEVALDATKSLRGNWGLGENDIAIGFAGRLVAWKGVLTLLTATALLKKAWPSEGQAFKVIIAGEGRGQAGENTQELKDYVREQQLETVVNFVGFQPEMDSFYGALDVFVHPSLKPEPFATVVVEAMAAGLPVVAAAAGGTLEIIRDGENGLLFPLGGAVALAEKLRRLLSDEALRHHLGAAAQQTVKSSFTEEATTQQMEQIYGEVLGQEGR